MLIHCCTTKIVAYLSKNNRDPNSIHMFISCSFETFRSLYRVMMKISKSEVFTQSIFFMNPTRLKSWRTAWRSRVSEDGW